MRTKTENNPLLHDFYLARYAYFGDVIKYDIGYTSCVVLMIMILLSIAMFLD